MCVVERVHYHGTLNTLSRLYGISNYVDQKDCVEPDQSEDRVFECLLYQETSLALLVQPTKARTWDLITKSTAKHNRKDSPPDGIATTL